MTQQIKKQSNLLTIVATAHNEPESNRVFIDSIKMQTVKDFKAIVWHNGSYEQSDLHWWSRISNAFGHPEYKNSKINTANWGTVNRQQAIEECDTEYIIQTSVQDYWLLQSVEYIIKILKKHSPDILIWNSVNHLVGPCQVLDSKLEWSKVDWGNFCIRTDIAKKVGITHGDQYCADWLFIKDVLESGLVDPNKIIKLPYVLTIHN